MEHKPTVILVSRNFPPLQGGMERLCHHIHQELQAEYRVVLVGPDGAERHCSPESTVRTSPALPVWRFLAGSLWHCLRLAILERPAFILAGSGVAALPAVITGKLTQTPVVTFLHGLDIVAANPIYQHVFLPFIRRSSLWLVNSQNTRRLAIDAGMPAERIEIIHPGTTLPEAMQARERHPLQRWIGEHDGPILLSVGRITRRKGLPEFIEQCMPTLIRQLPDILLVVIGDSATHAIGGQSGDAKNGLKRQVEAMGLSDHVHILGSVEDTVLDQAYAAANLLIFPVRDLPGDVEGFGMVAVEAAAHGLPTIAFAAGGVPDAIQNGISGTLVTPGDYGEMTRAILDMIGRKSELSSPCRAFAAQFSWPIFGGRLRKILRQRVRHIEERES